jgi:outer membrane protein
MEYRKSSGLILLLAALLQTSALHAGPERALTLKEAVTLSLSNNKNLKIADAKTLEAKAKLQEARLRRYPDVSVSAAHMRVNQPNVDLKVPTGNAESGGGQSPIAVDQLSYGMANASLPLFSGFRIREGISSAHSLHKAAELDARRDKEEIIQHTIEAFYDLYKAQAAVTLVHENLRQAEARVHDFTKLEQNGLLARNDLLKAQLQQSNIELSLLDAENNLEIANFNMDLMLGLEPDTRLQPDTSGLSDLSRVQNMSELEQAALSQRPDYRSMVEQRAAAQAGIKASQADYYPSLAVTGGYIAADIPGLLRVTNAVNVGLGLSYNLGSLYKNGAKVQQAKAREMQIEAGIEQLNEGIRVQVHKAYFNYLESVKKIDVYRKAVEQASENYRIVKNKHENALATTTDLLDADVARLQAHIQYEFAKADAMVAWHKLGEVSGTTSFAEGSN